MKKNLKRWLALLLAITMIVTSGAFTNLTYLRATDSETPEAAASAETQQETKTEEKEKEKKQEVKVEAKDDKAAEEAKKAEEEAKAKAEAEAKAEEQKKAEEAAKADEQKKAEEAAKADEQKAEESATTEEAQKSNEETKTEETVTPAEAAQEDQKAEESAKEENKEQTYDITIKEPGKDGGSIRAWVGDAGKSDVSFKNGKYVKEVKEGQTFHFEIKTKDGYSLDKVKAGDEKIKAKKIDGNTYTYELKNVKENETLNLKYKEEKVDETQTTEAGETQNSENGATKEETSSDDGDVPQQEAETPEEQITADEQSPEENPTAPEQSVVEEQTEEKSAVEETQQVESKPAQKLVATASDGAKVTVNAPEGALPEGSSVNVSVVRSKFVENAVAEAVEGEGKELVGYKAYDITIVGPDGNEIQPEDTVKVNIKNADVNGEDATVYHVENGNADKVADVSSTENANFSAEHFSIYVIAGAETKAVATYEFYDGETKVNTQKVKDGETLNKPDVPVHDGKYFTGWFVEGTDAKVDFDTPVSVAATSTVKVVARYEEAYYVYFKNTAGVVVATKQGKNGDAISVDDVSFPLAADEGISGWYTEKELTNRVEGTVTLNDANVTVYPKVEKGYYITYDAEGGTYTKPVFVAPRQKTTAPAEPTRLGYTFKCWSTQQNGEAYTFGNELEKDITLHAVWEAKTVTYHVIYWKENADYQNTYLPENLRDKEQYEFDSTKDLQGYTGQQTVVDGWNGNVPAGFTLQTISQQEIKGDGSTIVNVYLNRNIYEVKFYPNGKSPICGKEEHTHGMWCYKFNGTLKCKKEEHTHTTDCYANYGDKTIRAKYGANINSAWPKNSNNTTDWAVDGKDDTYQVNIDTMPLNGAIFNEPSKRKGTESATYYVEVLPGENGTNVDGKTYKEHHTDISGGTGYSVTKEDRYPITGFTLNEDISTSTGGRYNNAKFYYTRNKYNVVFNNNGETVNTVEAYYQASLSGTGDYKPTAPAGKEGYTFAGWYTNSLGEGTPFNFDTATMPARNITVYAKWVAPTFTASVHVTVDGSGKAVDITKEAGTKLLASELPTINVPEGSTFRGWYLFENGKRTTAFNFNTEIHENITLVPYWTSDTTHTVAYEANGASGNVPVDGNAYAEGAYAEVLDNTSLTGPDGSPYFTGWKSNVDDQIYYPGDKIEITADITFTAQWSNQPYTSLTYYANNGTDESKSDSYPNNETVTLKGKDLFAYNNYNFKGWNTNADGTGTAFAAGAQVIVDNIGTNALYAQWEKKEGQIGYNLTLSGATIETTGWSKKDGYKYTVDNEYYKYPDTFTVTNRVPKCEGFEFLGWFDKARESGDHSSSPAIRKAGDSVSFIYTGEDVYTLDALWASINAEGATYPYDGEEHTIKSAEVAYNSGNLAEKYVKQITDNHLVSVDEMQYATEKDGTYTSTMPTFKDVGTHDVYCKTTVQVGSTAKALTTKATVTITPATVTVTADNKSKVYGAADPTLTATVAGLVKKDKDKVQINYSLSRATGEDVRSYEITATGENVQGNYNVIFKKGTFNITQRAITVKAKSDSKSYDGKPLKASVVGYEITEGTLVKGDVETVALSGEITLVGSCDAEVTTVVIKNKEEQDVTSNYNVTFAKGELIITDTEVDGNLVITKTHTAGTYKLGDTITFKISVTNIYNAPKTITLKEQEGVTFADGKTSMTLELAAGETRTVEAKYVLTEADIVRTTFTNTVRANVGNKTFTATDTVPTTEIAEANPYLKITKVVEPEDSTKIYKLDEVVKYKITVKNAGNLTLKNVKVEDAKTGLKQTISTLAPNETKEFTTSYRIQEKDVRAGKFDNVATGSAENPSDKQTKVDKGEATVPTETAKSSLYVEKTVTNASEDGFAEGDEIIFNIHVINNGNQTITGIAITDALVGNTGDNTLKVKDLKPGEEDTVRVKYTVTQNDLVKGSVKNEATATGTDPSNKTVSAKDEATATTVETNPSLVVKKDTISQPANGSTYALGETIRYRITVTNTGNLDLTNVKIIDRLANVEKINPKDWTIAKLAVGDSASVEATYTVTKADILNGEVVNAALAEAGSPDGKEPKVEGAQTVDQTDAQNPHMTVVKTTTSTPRNGMAYALGETITYKITVTNDGNVDLTNVKVIDNKEGLVKHGAGLLTRDWPTLTLLAVGQTREFTASYTVTQNDLIAGNVVNDATATGTAPGDNEPTVVPGNTDDSTEKANADYTVTKTVDNPKAEYKVGDVINYTIRVTNTGNLTLNNLTVTDQMQGASGNAVIANRAGVTVNGNTATIATLAVGASIELKASYTVARADADGTLANRVNVTSTTKPGEDPENPNGPTTPSKSDETDPTPAEKTYVLTIHYVDNNGNAVAQDYTARLLAGETIDAVVSPAIDGYTPNFGTVVLPATGMPAANITVTVIYTPDGPDEVLDNPENPNQPNNGGNNGGGNAVNNNNNNANNANNADNGNNAANNNAGQADANPAPADGVIQPDDNGGYDLTPVEDTPTPLANMNLDDHACCILHFLIMLLTLIIFALYTKSRKNRQLKVEELREQLAIASIQKELDLSDEDMAKYLEEAKKLAEEKKQANA